MNRRSFLLRLGQAAAAAVVLDPEELLWVPGKKTIIDLGATKQVLPATDRELLELTRQRFQGAESLWATQLRRERRDVRLDILDGGEVKSFNFQGDQLVGVYSEADLRTLQKPFFRTGGGRASIDNI